MTTRIAIIDKARNEDLKGKSHSEINAIAKSILSGKNFTNEECAYFNQVMIEYHLARMEIDDAYDSALDYLS